MNPSRPSVLLTGASGFIGTNLVENLQADGFEPVNLDLAPPLDPRHRDAWIEADILDADALRHHFAAHQPAWVIHLAARTDCVEDTTVEEGYRTNTDGTRNVLEAIRVTGSVQRSIITSSQYVCGPQHGLPRDDTDYGPHTVYGQSKVLTEQLTRDADPPGTWVLIRPANIWGPWHLRYRREFWRVAEKGLYLHPGRQPVVRTYGYVGNVVYQIRRLLEAEPEKVHRKTFYVGDLPGDIFGWTDGFCRALTGRPARVAPRTLLRGLALAGDLLKPLGIRFPLTTSRYRNMIGDYPTPMQETWDLLGPPPFSLEQGIETTVEWLRAYNREHGTS